MKKEEIQPWIQDIIWMARRYADGRKTYAPDMFNRAYDALKMIFTEEELDKHKDDVVKTFPYASEN